MDDNKQSYFYIFLLEGNESYCYADFVRTWEVDHTFQKLFGLEKGVTQKLSFKFSFRRFDTFAHWTRILSSIYFIFALERRNQNDQGKKVLGQMFQDTDFEILQRDKF